MADIRRRARETVIKRYDLRTVCLPRHVALVDAVASGRLPPDLDVEIASAPRATVPTGSLHPDPFPRGGEGAARARAVS
jgi:hypothetical protein